MGGHQIDTYNVRIKAQVIVVSLELLTFTFLWKLFLLILKYCEKFPLEINLLQAYMDIIERLD